MKHPHSLIHLNAELNPICHLLALLEAHLIFHVSRIRIKNHNVYDCVLYNEPTSAQLNF